MMSSESNIPSSSFNWKYDVFISFRGEDTRNNFTSHLYTALNQRGINVFADDKELERGKSISPELLRAIEESRFSIIVFSENYAYSTWCLDELVKIVECKNTRTDQQMIFPIFYHVEPTVARKQKGKFQEAFTKHEDAFKGDIGKVQKWRDALNEVASISGWELTKNRSESAFIEDVVKKISSKVIPTIFETQKDLVGINSRLEKLRLLLDMGTNAVRMIGIWGMGGLGKTTIARAVYDSIHSKFEESCFLANVREISNKSNLISLQNQLLSEVVKLSNRSIQNVHDGINMIGSRMRRKKVLLVIDDAVDLDQLDSLAGSRDWFGSGSRIIITSRDKQLLKTHGVDAVYELEKLNDDESLGLFCMKAFKSHQPSKDYEDLSKRVIWYAAGLPLALKVLGSSLFGRTVQVWESTLRQLKTDSADDIVKILQISFDELEEAEKKIFLDIACFFNRRDRDYVTIFLEGCGFHPMIGIDVLIEKSLISIEDNRIQMHNLLQQMGQQIVRRQSMEPGNRSRLWEEADVRHVLLENTGTDVVEGIMHRFSKGKMHLSARAFSRMTNLKKMHLSARAFSRMTNLRLLKISNVQLPEGLHYLSNELRLLAWHEYPLKSFPSNFRMEKILELDLHGSSIQQLWQGMKHLNMLKVMKLGHCQNLIRTPDFTGASNLEKLILEGCAKLENIHQSLLVHEKLAVLNMRGCSSLKKLPKKIAMNSLTKFVLSGCSKLQNFPEIERSMECLSELSLSGTAITVLPFSIDRLPGLVLLNLKDCKNLKSLPDTIGGLKRLKTLNLSGCSQLKKFPKTLGTMEYLLELFLDGTAITELPLGIGCLRCLKTLNLSGCLKFKKFPDIVGNMECMSKLSLDGSAIVELPLSIKFMQGLVWLSLKDCKNLETLPTTLSSLKRLKTLNLSGCSKLKTFPKIVYRMECLSKLYLDGTAIEELPLSVELLSGLARLYLKNCNNLVRLPSTINCLKSLKTLNLSGCSKLENVPNNLGEVDSLECLNLSGTAIREPPSSISLLKNLRKLSFRGCKGPPTSKSWFSGFRRRSSDRMGLILPSLSGLCSLWKLDLSDCNLGEGAIPSDICNLSSLEILNLGKNNFVSLPGTINRLPTLKYLYLEDCKRLQSLPELSFRMYMLRLDGCISLQTVLEAFIFIQDIRCVNCLKLVSNQDYVFSVLKRFIEAKPNPRNSFRLVIPGSKIPEWFRYQNEGSSIKVTSPPNSYNRKKLVGYAICCVFHVQKPTYKPNSHTGISLNFRNVGSALYFEEQSVQPGSDHLWLRYYSCDQLSKSNHIEVSSRPDYNLYTSHGVKKCGVHPVYVDESDDEVFDAGSDSKDS